VIKALHRICTELPRTDDATTPRHFWRSARPGRRGISSSWYRCGRTPCGRERSPSPG
jgi:hypothetical protein